MVITSTYYSSLALLSADMKTPYTVFIRIESSPFIIFLPFLWSKELDKTAKWMFWFTELCILEQDDPILQI